MSISTGSNGTQAVPEPVARIDALMKSYGRPWALCGGWAVSAWLGRTSRDHGDVDISIFADDHRDLFGHLAGWQLIAHTSTEDDVSTAAWDGRRLEAPSHIHARAPEDAGPLPEDGVCNPAEGWWLDIQVDDGSGSEWVLRREPRVSLPASAAIATSPWGLPAALPEVLLFFKAMEPRRRDWRDFVALLPHLSESQMSWLRDAIASVAMDHPWVPALAWASSTPR